MATTELSRFEYEDRILQSLRKREGVATAGDVAADTGLPLEETELALRHMLTFYTSHLDVDDDGNLLYRFDPALRRRGEEPGLAWHRFKQAAWRGFKFFFKIWIMVTLVGYTAIFLLLLLAMAVAGMAASASSNDDRGGGGQIFFFPLYLFARVLEVFFWISIFDDRRGYGHYGGGRRRMKSQKPEKPVYQRIFDYVFGPEQKRDPLAAERAFAQFVRSRRGRVTAAEWSSRTGLSLADAENALTGSAMRFRGDIDVSDDGVLVYRFDDLRVTADETGTAYGSTVELAPIWRRRAVAPPLTGNKGSTNTWISVFNGFNLLMSIFVLATVGLPLGAYIGLGYVPLVFSLLFFGIPLARRIQHGKLVREVEAENARRRQMEAVFLSAESGQARPIVSDALQEPAASQLLVDFEGDVEIARDGQTLYLFPRVAEQLAAAEQARTAAAENLVFGKTVFSSDERTLSLEESELEEFDRLLARELGQTAFDFESAPAPASSFVEAGRS